MDHVSRGKVGGIRVPAEPESPQRSPPQAGAKPAPRCVVPATRDPEFGHRRGWIEPGERAERECVAQHRDLDGDRGDLGARRRSRNRRRRARERRQHVAGAQTASRAHYLDYVSSDTAVLYASVRRGPRWALAGPAIGCALRLKAATTSRSTTSRSAKSSHRPDRACAPNAADPHPASAQAEADRPSPPFAEAPAVRRGLKLLHLVTHFPGVRVVASMARTLAPLGGASWGDRRARRRRGPRISGRHTRSIRAIRGAACDSRPGT